MRDHTQKPAHYLWWVDGGGAWMQGSGGAIKGIAYLRCDCRYTLDELLVGY